MKQARNKENVKQRRLIMRLTVSIKFQFDERNSILCATRHQTSHGYRSHGQWQWLPRGSINEFRSLQKNNVPCWRNSERLNKK